jgi:hypothetical protein
VLQTPEFAEIFPHYVGPEWQFVDLSGQDKIKLIHQITVARQHGGSEESIVTSQYPAKNMIITKSEH